MRLITKQINDSIHRHLLAAVSIATLCVLGIFFFAANTHWIPVYVPSWTAPVETGFEIAFGALVLIVFLSGVGTATVFFRTKCNDQFRTIHALERRINLLESELKKSRRLIDTTTRDHIGE